MGRNIYVRDIYRQYHVKGINEELYTIDLVCGKLKELSNRKKVITCDNSIGGEMAVITRIKL